VRELSEDREPVPHDIDQTLVDPDKETARRLENHRDVLKADHFEAEDSAYVDVTFKGPFIEGYFARDYDLELVQGHVESVGFLDRFYEDDMSWFGPSKVMVVRYRVKEGGEQE